jgi:menaquinone-9 beta-reductase
MNALHDVVVIGAGPAGSTAAILLAKAGWKVALVEKARFPRRKVCGEFLSAAAWPLLDELGVASRIASMAGPEVHRVGLFAGRERLAAPMPRSAMFRGRALGREHLDTVLMERAAAAGAHVVQGDARDGSIKARVVIDASGAWHGGSASAHELLGFKAHFRHATLPRDLMPLVLFPGGYGGMVHTDDGRVSLSCCVRRDALALARSRHRGLRASEALHAHIVAANRGVSETLADARLDGEWLSAGPIRPAIRAFRREGAFIVGNAAGEAHPIIAEGISMAIQSSFLLCERLIAAGAAAPESALEQVARGYEHAWRGNFAKRVHAAALFAALTTHPMTQGLAVSALKLVPGLLTLGAHWSGKDVPLRRVQRVEPA